MKIVFNGPISTLDTDEKKKNLCSWGYFNRNFQTEKEK